jgi:hypothetical protein
MFKRVKATLEKDLEGSFDWPEFADLFGVSDADAQVRIVIRTHTTRMPTIDMHCTAHAT